MRVEAGSSDAIEHIEVVLRHLFELVGFRQILAEPRQDGIDAELLLFFGCRDPLLDFLYEDEMRAFETAGVTRLFPVFSREPGKPKTYVQEAIKNHSAEVWRLLQQEAVVFVCGEASGMAPDVRQAFAAVFQERTGAGAADAQAWLSGLVATRRYLEDIWASDNASFSDEAKRQALSSGQ